MLNTLTITLTDDQLADLVAYIPLVNPFLKSSPDPIVYLTQKVDHELSLAKNARRGNSKMSKAISALSQADDTMVDQVALLLKIDS